MAGSSRFSSNRRTDAAGAGPADRQGLVDEQDKLSNESTRAFLSKYLETFASWIERNRNS